MVKNIIIQFLMLIMILFSISNSFAKSKSTELVIFTTTAQDTIINCNNNTNLDSLFNVWIENLGGATVDNFCNPYIAFAAVPGSYDTLDFTTFPGTEVGLLNYFSCPSDQVGILRSETVDFVFYDNCNNVLVTTATFSQIDDNPPEIISCPNDSVYTIVSGCEQNVSIQTPNVIDDCGELVPHISRTITEEITAPIQANDVIIDPLYFRFGPFFLPTPPSISSTTLKISLFKIDGNLPSERFHIISESNDTLALSPNTIEECADTFLIINLLPSQIELWVEDGYIEFEMQPIITSEPIAAINDICGNSTVKMDLDFDIDLSENYSYSFQIDGGNRIFPSSIATYDTILPVGSHEIVYYFVDCAQNESSCSSIIDIIELEAPQLSCYNDSIIVLPLETCSFNYLLPTQFHYTDNCNSSIVYQNRQPEKIEDAYIPFEFNSELDTFIASDILVQFKEVLPVLFSNDPINLTIFIKGDVANNLAYFDILGEDNISLGDTKSFEIYSGDCDNISIATFQIPTQQFNLWAADSVLNITAISNVDPLDSNKGINPCGTLTGNIDSNSVFYSELKYYDASIQYQITGATNINITPLSPDSTYIHLNSGLHTVYFITSDPSNNSDTCSYLLDIQDNQPPTAFCKDTSIYINPLVNSDFTLLPNIFDSLSYDNCGIDRYSVSPAHLNCMNIGQTIPVTIYIWDEMNNLDSCTSYLEVNQLNLNLSYSEGICEGDTLFLFSNTLHNPENEYSWTGPDGFLSTDENPYVVNPTEINNGIYTLNVINPNACSTTGELDVQINLLRTPLLNDADTIICEMSPFKLEINNFSSTAKYIWYEGDYENFTILDTTEVNKIELNPEIGLHGYYVIIANDNCISDPSEIIQVEAIIKPEAKIKSNFDEACKGDSIQLVSDLPLDTTYSYQWTGPNNYYSENQNNTILNSVLEHDGFYKFVVSKGACISDTVQKRIVINNRPDLPIINSPGVFCEKNPIQLTIQNVIDADKYYWMKDGIDYEITADNELDIPNATTNLEGKWTVVAVYGECYSDTSSSHEITVVPELDFGISGPAKACIGDTIQYLAPFIQGAIYNWTGPGAFDSHEQNPMVPAIEGEYQLLITTDDHCSSSATIYLDVAPVPNITAISNDASACMDGNTSVHLNSSVFPITDYTYSWSGPNAYESSDINPIIENADSTINGTYTLIINNEFCASEPLTTIIDIVNTPLKPSILIEDNYCLGADITIQIEGETGEGLIYIWNTPLGQVTTQIPSLNIINLKEINAGLYSVYLQRENCLSESADQVELNIRTLPETVSILGQKEVCEGESITITTSNNNFESFEWVGPNDVEIEGESLTIDNFSAENSGAYFLRVYDGFCYSKWSSPLIIKMLSKPQSAEISYIPDAVCNKTGNTIELCLDENTLTSGATYSVIESLNNTILASGQSSCLNIENLSLLETGINYIYIQTTNNGCVSNSSTTKEIRIDTLPSHIAQIEEGDELHFCLDGAIVLNTDPPAGTSLLWHTDEDFEIKSPNNKTTVIKNLELGQNELYLSYSEKSCINYSSDTIHLYIEEEPIAYNDDASTDYNEAITLNVVENDEYSSDIILAIVEHHNNATLNIENNQLHIIPDPGYIGLLEFEYQICNKYCPDKCHTAVINLQVGESSNCFAPSIITPNNDDINDAFIIPCLSSNAYTNNKLIIFNQWGDSVFEAMPYHNDWKGTYKNKDLPIGTYFYVLDLGTNQEQLKGFVRIER